MVMRLNKICLGITEVSLSNSPSLPSHPDAQYVVGKKERKEGFLYYSNLVLHGHWHRVPKDQQKEVFIPLK